MKAGPIRERFPVYTRGNVEEVFPYPVSPLLWTAMVPNTDGGWRDGLTALGAFDHDEFNQDHPEPLNQFGGYLYLNLSIMRTFATRAPGMTPDLMDAGITGGIGIAPPHVDRPGDESPVHTERIGATMARILTTEDVSTPEEDRRRCDAFVAARPDLGTASEAGLLDRFRVSMAETRPMLADHLGATLSSSVAVGVISTICAEALGDPALTYDLLSGLGDIASAAPSFHLWKVGRIVASAPELMAAFDAGVAGLLDRVPAGENGERFTEAFDAVIAKYPFRGPDEYNPVAPTWGTCPELALAAIDRMRLASNDDSPVAKHTTLVEQRAKRTDEALHNLAEAPAVAEQMTSAIKAAKVFVAAREAGRINLVIPIHEGRLALRELGTRMVARGHLERWEDLQVLEDAELEEFLADPARFSSLIADRVKAFAELYDLVPPFIVNGELPPAEAWTSKSTGPVVRPVEPGTVLQGIGGCPGQLTGIARVVLDPMHPEGLKAGEILVAPLTDPAWTPLFVAAGAVIVETGAVLSHAVIVSRELGIPCVVALTGATKKIPDGARITLDGLAGTVTVH
jgi:pyruvate,water dikinase